MRRFIWACSHCLILLSFKTIVGWQRGHAIHSLHLTKSCWTTFSSSTSTSSCSGAASNAVILSSKYVCSSLTDKARTSKRSLQSGALCPGSPRLSTDHGQGWQPLARGPTRPVLERQTVCSDVLGLAWPESPGFGLALPRLVTGQYIPNSARTPLSILQ